MSIPFNGSWVVIRLPSVVGTGRTVARCPDIGLPRLCGFGLVRRARTRTHRPFNAHNGTAATCLPGPSARTQWRTEVT